MQDPSLLKSLEKKKRAPIIEAILQDDVFTLLVLVDNNPSVLEERNYRETLGGTVLHLATKLGREDMVEIIINLCPSLVRITNPEGDTPLHFAARWGHATIVTSILESGEAFRRALNGQGETAFAVACRYNHPDVANLIFEKLSSITIVEFYATILGEYKDLARKALAKVPTLAWEVDGDMSTPLHLACVLNNLDVVKMLLELDEALAESVNKDGLTPLHVAAMKCSAEILNEFSDKAPRSFDILTLREQQTVFHLAAEHSNIEAFIFMAESSDRSELLHKVNTYGATALHMAVIYTCYPIILYIIYETTIDISAETISGRKAIDCIMEYDMYYQEISYWLKDEANEIRNPQYLNPRQGSYWKGSTETQLLDSMKKLESQMLRRREPPNREREMHAEALQNARNTITIVAVLIASLAFTGGINPPGGVYLEGPSIGKSTAGRTVAFKIFSISNNLALFTSLCIVVLLVSIIPYRTKPLMNFLVITHRMMWVAVLSMATAYLAAAWILVPHLRGTSWLFYTILAISSVTLGGLFVYLGYKLMKHMSKKVAWRRNVTSVPVVPTNTRADNWTSVASDRGAAAAQGYYIY